MLVGGETLAGPLRFLVTKVLTVARGGTGWM